MSGEWRRTGVWHTEPCGCVYDQHVEVGTDYHERWELLVRCPKHSLLGERAARAD